MANSWISLTQQLIRPILHFIPLFLFPSPVELTLQIWINVTNKFIEDLAKKKKIKGSNKWSSYNITNRPAYIYPSGSSRNHQGEKAIREGKKKSLESPRRLSRVAGGLLNPWSCKRALAAGPPCAPVPGPSVSFPSICLLPSFVEIYM